MYWLVGCGSMAKEYAKVLLEKKIDFIAIGRGSKSADEFKLEFCCEVTTGGIEEYLLTNPSSPKGVIVCVGVESLFDVASRLLNFGIKKILLEKPGATTSDEIETLLELQVRMGSEIYLAYNRRFYASVQQAKKIIDEDGGVASFNFELTEWSHVIAELNMPKEVLSKWFLANSTHVADLAFYLGGEPEDISCYTSGGLDWHNAASIFSGAGVTKTGALFTYNSNWESAGRWSVEILTKKHRLIFKPLEMLQVQNRGEINVETVPISNELDLSFKPGLYLQVESFLGDCEMLCSLREQVGMFKVYEKMAGYIE